MSADTDVSLSSHDEDQGSKLIQKAKEAPFVPTAMAGFAAITAYGLYKLKSRGNTKIHSCGCPRLCCGSNDSWYGLFHVSGILGTT
uniref:HIG1 domain-containing protein n=1 Tax=Sus scrofa TaxID=9823 RepID=A0A4X1UCH1_PIG